MKKFIFDGINLAITTPFDDKGKIDYQRLETLIEQYLQAGIRSFVLSSGTGMHVYLSKAESKDLIKNGAAIINGRARFIAQTSALMVDEVIERTVHAAEHGASGVMVLPPFFEGPTDDDGVYNFYQEVSSAGLPIIGYNVPQAVGVTITPELLKRLAEIENFCTVKDSSGDLAIQAELIQTGIPVMNGADPLMPYALYAGASGLIWGGANFAPKLCLAVVSEIQKGNWSAAREKWELLVPAMNLIWKGNYVQSVYAAACMTGYAAGAPRKPLSKLSAEQEAVLEAALAGIFANELA